jgi:hypothetical protein
MVRPEVGARLKAELKAILAGEPRTNPGEPGTTPGERGT